MRSSCATHFHFFLKIAFSAFFLAKILALKMQISKIFVPKTPNFFKKIHSLDPTFGNLLGTYLPKKSWVPPPGSEPVQLVKMQLFQF